MITLAQVIARVESADNPYALRFEPATYLNIGQSRFDLARAAAKSVNKCSIDTANVILSTSWGRFQIMGFNLYAKATHCVGEYMASDAAQLFALSDMLAPWAMSPDDNADWILTNPQRVASLATRYNGPGNVADYSALLVAAYKALAA